MFRGQRDRCAPSIRARRLVRLLGAGAGFAVGLSWGAAVQAGRPPQTTAVPPRPEAAAVLHVDVDDDGIVDQIAAYPTIGDWSTGRIGAVVITSGIDHTLLAHIEPRGREFFGIGIRQGDGDGDDLLVRSILPPGPNGTDSWIVWRRIDLETCTIVSGGLLADTSADWRSDAEMEARFGIRPLRGDLNHDGVVDREDLAVAAASGAEASEIGVIVNAIGTSVGRIGWARGPDGAVLPGWSGGEPPSSVARGWDIDCDDCFFEPRYPGRPGGPGTAPDGIDDFVGSDTDRPITIPPPPAPDLSWCFMDTDGDGVPEVDEDSDCDGIPNGEDCDSPCYQGGPVCCMDLDGDGVPDQDNVGSPCYRQPMGGMLADINGDGIIDEDDTIDDEDAGIIILVNSLDHDRDGFPDLADGLNLIDHPDVLDDDACPLDGLMTMSIGLGSAGPDDIITLTYDASDPMGTDPTSLTPGPGYLRLWLHFDGGRDPRPVSQGGHYVAPGTYAVGELTTGDELSVYVEAVRPSPSVGDQSIDVVVEVEREGDDAPCVTNSMLRWTAVQVVIEAQIAGEELWRPWPLLVSSYGTPAGLAPLPEGLLESTWAVHRMRVMDPRGHEDLESFELAEYALPLRPHADGAHVTPAFMCVRPDQASDAIDHPRVLIIDGPSVPFSYNPGGVIHVNLDLSKVPEYQREVVKLIEEVTKEMREEDWPPTELRQGAAARDTGLFGKEVHRRVSERLTDRERWLVDPVIEVSTGRIHRFGGNGAKGYVQLDLLRLKEGYVPQVGDVLDTSMIDDVIDVKAGLHGTTTANQLANQRLVTGQDVTLARSLYRYSSRQGWHLNHIVQKRGRLARALGAAGRTAKGKAGKALGGAGALIAVHALINNSRYDDELDEIATLMIAAQHEDDVYQKTADVLLAMDKLTTYLGRFSPDPDSVKVIGHVAFLKAWGSS